MKRSFAFVLVMVLSLAFLLPSGASASALSDRYEEAKVLLSEGHFDEAGDAFKALGIYEDANKYAMYCAAASAGESGLYALAVTNLVSLGDFLDSSLLALYYTGLSQETVEDYESAQETLSGILFYRDVSQRVLEYPEKINDREYRKAEAAENAGRLEEALKGFTDLGGWRDSAERASAVQEKINVRDYQQASDAEERGQLEKALEGFRKLGTYSDSRECADAVQEKIFARDYAAADKAEQQEDYAAAYQGFLDLGDYQDSKARASAVQNKGSYAQALKDFQAGKIQEAQSLFASLGEYEDSADKAWLLSEIPDSTQTEILGDGIAAYCFHDAWGIINLKDNLIISPRWASLGFVDPVFGLMRAEKNEKFGYVNSQGDEVIPCVWDDVSSFSEEGICTVVQGNQLGLVRNNGETVTKAQWLTIGLSNTSKRANGSLEIPDFSDGKIKVQNQNGLWGFLDTEGNTVGEVKWKVIDNFREGLALVAKDGKIGYIDGNGQVIIEPEYRDAMGFSEGLAAVRKTSGWQYIDRNNNVVISGPYTDARSFHNEKADVRFGEDWGVIDKAGNLLNFQDLSYRNALALKDAGQYEEAAALFAASKAPDAKDQENECHNESVYQKAKRLYDEGNFEQAIEIYQTIKGYKDVDDLLEDIEEPFKYLKAKQLYDEGDFEQAYEIYQMIKGYKDVDDLLSNDENLQLNEIKYQKAQRLYNAGEYEKAYDIYQTINGYKDVDNLLAEDENMVLIVAKRNRLKVGSVVAFGHYEQDNKLENGPEEIEWIVLDVQEGKALLLSKYGLDAVPFDEERKDNYWETCFIRNMMNAEFINNAFSIEERSAILPAEIDNGPDQGSTKWKTDGGNNTIDYLFLLSVHEAFEQYFQNDEDRLCAPTDYAIAMGAFKSAKRKIDNRDTGWWWLRSPGRSQYYAAGVSSSGTLSDDRVHNDIGVIRPAFWLNLESDIF